MTSQGTRARFSDFVEFVATYYGESKTQELITWQNSNAQDVIMRGTKRYYDSSKEEYVPVPGSSAPHPESHMDYVYTLVPSPNGEMTLHVHNKRTHSSLTLK